MLRTLLVITGATSIGLTSCNGVTCGEGTFASGDSCLAYDPNDMTAPVTVASPTTTRSREPLPPTIALTSDEPATIYFTTDGSDPDPMTQTGETSPVTIVDIEQGMTLKWFAIDRSGNREALQTTVLDSDVTPPEQVTGFAVTMNGTTAQISWTPPADADYAGTAIARVNDIVDVGPTPGMTLAAGMLSSSVNVLQVGTGTSASDPGRLPGPIRYVAWTFDDLGNYSAPAVVAVSLPIGSMTAQLTYDTNAQSLAIPTSPANISLTGTTATLNGSTLTISLRATNQTTKYFHNFKAEVTGASNASFASADGTADGFAFEAFGPNLFAPNATETRDMVFNVTPGTTATIDLTFADHATMLTSNAQRTQAVNRIDRGSGVLGPLLRTTIRGPNDRATGQARRPLLTGQRYLDIPITHGAIERFDLLTGTRTAFASLGIGEKSNVQFVISTGAELIAGVKLGGKRRLGTIQLVRLDEALHVKETVTLSKKEDRGFAEPAVSADGRTLALALNQSVVLVDLATLKEIDAVPSTEQIDSISIGGLQQRTRGPVLFNNGDGMLVMAKSGGKVATLKRTASGWTSSIYQDSNTNRGYGAAATPNGKVWVAQETGLRQYDPATEQFTTVPSYPYPPYSVNQVEGEMWIVRNNKYTLDQVSETGAVQRTITLPTTAPCVGHWIAVIR